MGIKILAPAYSYEGCLAAFKAGAHGVYLGAKNMSRGAAGSAVTDREMARCASLATSLGKIIHVAVNVIPDQGDAGLFVRSCRRYASFGVHGLILNDFGLIRMLVSSGFDIPIYASVGCGIANDADVEFFVLAGVAGIVLQPGTPPEFINNIRRKFHVKIEVFSEALMEPFMFGSCWLGSYLKMNRKNVAGKVCFFGSAKRGGCSRGCRARWEIAGDNSVLVQDYEFSFVPLSLSGSLKDYVGAGVDFIKIQGRGLPPGVVAGLVEKYSAELEELQRGEGQWNLS